MTEPTFTLAEARRLLARQQCEEDLQGGPLTTWSPLGRPQRAKRLEVLPLGHDLAKVFGEDSRLESYQCLRCGAEFVEVTGDQHQLPVDEPAT